MLVDEVDANAISSMWPSSFSVLCLAMLAFVRNRSLPFYLTQLNSTQLKSIQITQLNSTQFIHSTHTNSRKTCTLKPIRCSSTLTSPTRQKRPSSSTQSRLCLVFRKRQSGRCAGSKAPKGTFVCVRLLFVVVYFCSHQC